MNQTMQYCYDPIQDMQFKGLHWIEASAGTGKTYTLASLMVRIFLKDYLPSQVIATTFTRAAAAELKSRIRARLKQTLQYLEQCQGLSQPEIADKIKQETDPLLKKVLSDYQRQTDYASARLGLVIEQLDELFVGTLDSFSQKLLREFSFESGKIERAEITDRSDDYIEQLLHDVLREWIQNQPQVTIDHLVAKQRLKAPDAYLGLVRQSLNFASIKVQPVAKVDLNTQDLEVILQELCAFDPARLTELAEYYQGEYTANFSTHVAGKSGEKLQAIFLETLPELMDRLKTQALAQFFNPNLKAKFQQVFNIYLGSQGDWRSKIFNKATKSCTEEHQQAFLQHPILRIIKQLIEAQFQFEKDLDLFDSQLKFYLSSEVKRRLPQLLQQKGETTFAQQIRTLAESLKGEYGQHFAQYVHARYPLILVDEFQDTNQDQDDMLASIWRHPTWYARGCMIMVGDPKQAIYGFRGGDMLTYNQARNDVIAKQGKLYSLAQNHRSIKELVSVVDELFQRDEQFGEEVVYQPVVAGPRALACLYDNGAINPYPLRWLELQADEQEEIKIAWQIRALLHQAATDQLYFQQDQHKHTLQADDIAVLSTSHRSLDQVQYELERLGIRVNRSHKRSVFTGFLAKDVAAILTAILHPYDEAKVKRALLTRLLGYNLKQLIELEKQGLGQFIYDFDCIREMWMSKGFLTAWNYCLNLFNVWENLVAKQSFDNERHVVNLRHITDLLSKQSERRQGAYMLYQWYLKQLDAPGEREWEKERKLSNAAGVQLMTVHQSKGLEFKIVFLMGADKALKKDDKSPFAFSVESVVTDEKTVDKRVLSIRAADTSDEIMQQHQQRRLAELNRLWYVAVTRASYRIYAVVSATTPAISDQMETSKKTKAKAVETKFDGLNFWRLKPSKNAALEAIAQQLSQSEESLKQLPPFHQQNQQTAVQLHALNFPTRGFYPRTKTSFSRLAQHLPAKKLNDSLVMDDRVEEIAADEDHQTLPISTPQQQPIAWIKAQFPRGTNAGSFLHKLFENISFQDDRETILEQIKLRFKNDKEYLSEALLLELVAKHPIADEEQAKQSIYEQVTDWLLAVLKTPLHQDFALNQLSAKSYLAEFPFYLSLADQRLFVEKIKSLFDQIGKPIYDLNDATTARYLNGAIDLVYFDGQRYHIADYKSNFLGADQAHYDQPHLHENMSHSSYWLQAALYLVAIHRYLKSTMRQYDIAKHLGGASYLYLRGMNGEAQQGNCYWKPEDQFILSLDQMLGYFSVKNESLCE